MTTAVALQLLIAGLSIGSVYALVALGLVIVFKGTGVLNFAQGELVTLGAYLALFIVVFTKLPYAAVFVVTIALAAAIGFGLERGLLRPLIKAPPFTVVIATLAIGLMIKNALRLAWQEPVSSLPTPFSSDPIVLGALRVNPQYLWVIGCTFLVLGVMAAFFRLSRLGKAMRAVSQNQDAARLMGIPVGYVFSLTFAVGTVIAATAGILFAPLIGIEAEMGAIIIKGFVAAIVGGFTTLAGVVVGGLLLGLLETFGGAYFGGVFKNVAAFALLIVVLLLRPHGLFGRAEARRV
jgi:branched-chain amino acid transport system permease protein